MESNRVKRCDCSEDLIENYHLQTVARNPKYCNNYNTVLCHIHMVMLADFVVERCELHVRNTKRQKKHTHTNTKANAKKNCIF